MQTKETEYILTIIINSSEYYEIDVDSLLSVKNQTIGSENIQILLIKNDESELSELVLSIEKVFEDNLFVYGGKFETLLDIKELIKGQFFIYGWNNAKYALNTFEVFLKNKRINDENIQIICMHEKGKNKSKCVNTNLFSSVVDLHDSELVHLDSSSVLYKNTLLDCDMFVNCPYSNYFSTVLFYVACINDMRVFVSKKECVYKNDWAEDRYKNLIHKNNIIDYEWDIYDKCHIYLISCCVSRLSVVPKFVQVYLCMDLCLRIKGKRLGGYSTLEQSKLIFIKEQMRQILMRVSDENILNSKLVFSEDKAFLFELKYGKNALNLAVIDDDIIPSYYNVPLQSFQNMSFSLDFLQILNNELIIEGLFKYFIELEIAPQILGYLSYSDECGNEVSSSTMADTRLRDVSSNYSIGNTKVQQGEWFKLVIPLDESINNYKLSFGLNVLGKEIKKKVSALGKFFPINAKLDKSYYLSEKWIVKFLDNDLLICKASDEEKKKAEIDYCKQIQPLKLGVQTIELRKAYFELLKRKQKQIWLFSDRATVCDNNGKILFDYIRANHPEVDAYFILNRDAGEFDYLKKELGNQLIENGSIEHKLLYMLCDYYISSQFNVATRYPFDEDKSYFCDFIAREKFVYLQHGVIKDDMSWINQKRNQNFYGHIVSARSEYNSLYNEIDFNEKNLWLTGLARFDKLYHDEKKVICIAPTWRQWLMPNMNSDGMRTVNEKDFYNSKCYKFYQGLLTNKRLIDTAEKYGYIFWYSDHPLMKLHVDKLYHFDERVKVVDLPSDQINAQTNLMITDYSSAVFDFAYLRKPILYMQMDSDIFFENHSFVGKGYYDYERDGFGEVINDLEEAIDTIIDYIKNDCVIKTKYIDRIDAFFDYSDQNNCKRIFDEIVKRDCSEYFSRNHYAECMTASIDFQFLVMKIALMIKPKEHIKKEKIIVKEEINNFEYVPEQFYQGKLGLKAIFWCLKGWFHYKFRRRK